MVSETRTRTGQRPARGDPVCRDSFSISMLPYPYRSARPQRRVRLRIV